MGGEGGLLWPLRKSLLNPDPALGDRWPFSHASLSSSVKWGDRIPEGAWRRLPLASDPFSGRGDPGGEEQWGGRPARRPTGPVFCRSPRRPPPLLLQDADAPPLHRQLLLQAPAIALGRLEPTRPQAMLLSRCKYPGRGGPERGTSHSDPVIVQKAAPGSWATRP